MARTTLGGSQITDGSVLRDDLNTTTPGNAVVRKLIAGTNISFSWTGADSGTGDVTINASGGGGSPGGSNTQVQVNDAGAFAGYSGFTYDGTTNTLTVPVLAVASGAITSSTPITFSQTFNNAGVTFIGVSYEFTDTASQAASLLSRWKVGASDVASISKAGAFTSAVSYGNALIFSGINPRIAHTGAGSVQITSGGATFEFGNPNQLLLGGSGGSNGDYTIVQGTRLADANSYSLTIAGGLAWNLSTNRNGGAVNLVGGGKSGTGLDGTVNLGYTGTVARGFAKSWVPFQLDSTVVASLPSATTYPYGIFSVTDASSPALGNIVAGGGSSQALVQSLNGVWKVIGGPTASAGSITKGTAVIDFGSGADQKTITITTGAISSSSLVVLSADPAGTADHNSDDHALESYSLNYDNIVNGVSFDIVMTSKSLGNLYKQWGVSWAIL